MDYANNETKKLQVMQLFTCNWLRWHSY